MIAETRWSGMNRCADGVGSRARHQHGHRSPRKSRSLDENGRGPSGKCPPCSWGGGGTDGPRVHVSVPVTNRCTHTRIRWSGLRGPSERVQPRSGTALHGQWLAFFPDGPRAHLRTVRSSTWGSNKEETRRGPHLGHTCPTAHGWAPAGSVVGPGATGEQLTGAADSALTGTHAWVPVNGECMHMYPAYRSPWVPVT